MSGITDKRKFRKRVPEKPEILPGRLGDGFGNVSVDDMPYYVYCRIAGRVERVYNDRVPILDGIEVDVGRSIDNPEKFQVLGTRTYSPGGPGNPIQGGYAPAIRYQFMAAGGGQDPLWVEGRQFMPLRIGPSTGMTIRIERGFIWTGSAFMFVDYRTASMTAHIPSTAGKAALVLITTNTSGTLVATKGTEYTLADKTTAALVMAMQPAVPASTAYVHGLVRVYNGQTAVAEARTNTTDIIDPREALFLPTNIRWNDLRVEPTARTTGANAPSFEKYLDDAAGTSRGVNLYSFDDAAGGSEKEVFFTMQMPHEWLEGSAINIHVHWIGSVSDTTSTPRWGLEYAWKDIGQTFGDTTIVYATGNIDGDGVDDPDITALKHYITAFTAITPGATENNISSILIGRLFRDSANAADTYNAATNKCGLLYIDAHYQLTAYGGSNSEFAA